LVAKHLLVLMALGSASAILRAEPDYSVFSSIEVVASSEPVPITDMISGWDGGFQAGEYAYADARVRFGFEAHGWQLSREQRWYYYLSFTEQTSRFFNSLERSQPVSAGEIDLEAWSFQSYGLNLAKQFQLTDDWDASIGVSVFNIGHYQFGTLRGFAESGSDRDDLKASAVLDYHYDEDKILEYEDDDKKGRGYSLSFSVTGQLTADWQLSIQLDDAWNRLEFTDATFTEGCIEFNDPTNPLCDALSSASGRSGVSAYNTSIPSTFRAGVNYLPADLGVELFRHDEYLRAGLVKGWQTPVGELGVLGYSTRQFGGYWQSGWHQLKIVADDRQAARIRDLDLTLALKLRW